MKRSLYFIALIVCIVSMTVILTACGPSDDNSSPTAKITDTVKQETQSNNSNNNNTATSNNQSNINNENQIGNRETNQKYETGNHSNITPVS